MLSSITGALYSLSVLVSCIAVKDTSQLLLRTNTSVSSCCLSAVVREMLKLCPRSFHVWGSKLKSGCIIFMAAGEESRVVETYKASQSFHSDDAYVTSAHVPLANAHHMTRLNISGVGCAVCNGEVNLQITL